MYVKEDLLTQDGGLVATVRVPVFKPPPIVIVYRGRFFVRHIDDRYIEGSAYLVPAWR